jgi:hypothetical protein
VEEVKTILAEVTGLQEKISEAEEKRTVKFNKWVNWQEDAKDLTDEFDLNEGKRE